MTGVRPNETSAPRVTDMEWRRRLIKAHKKMVRAEDAYWQVRRDMLAGGYPSGAVARMVSDCRLED